MLTFLYTFGAAVATSVLGWGIMIEPRIQVQKQAQIDLKELILSKLESIDGRLNRIEKSYNGHLFKD